MRESLFVNNRHRYEQKYLVHFRLLRVFEAAIAPFVELDPYHRLMGGSYVSTLYFDDYNGRAFWEKVAGGLDRSKFRARFYGKTASEASYFFLERKFRQGIYIAKQRCKIDSQNFRLMLSSKGLACGNNVPDTVPKLDFERGLRTGTLLPSVGILYFRTAYLGKTGHDVRISFDTQIAVCRAGVWLGTESGSILPLLAPAHGIIEIKCKANVPFWVKKTLNGLQLTSQSVCKYAMGVQKINSVYDNAFGTTI